MRVLVQRVSRAEVRVDGAVVGRVARGVLLLVGITATDTDAEASWLAEKIAGLRIFPDAEDKMNLSLVDIGGAALVVSQFTLYGDVQKGRRPSFVDAARPDVAEPLYRRLITLLQAHGVPCEAGVFGAMMDVELVNDGPVTLWLER